ncbi:MAG TPA: hypothetical protein VH639_25140 [Bryobacteraceae bacterium]|jgi:hypothetical protein
MIDSGLSMPLMPVILFHLKQIFWFDVWPAIVGFTTIFCYQIYMRIGLSGARNKWLIFTLASLASMLALFGWTTMVRTTQMIPLYGCGVGLASLLASQIYAVTLPRHTRFRIPFPKAIWRSDERAIRRLHKAMGPQPVPRRTATPRSGYRDAA